MQVPASDPDVQLVRAMADGDVHALDELYTRYGPGLLNYLVYQLNNRQLAEEVLQDVMLAVWRNAPSFRGESRVKTWLITIARNRAINARRGRAVTMVELNETFDSDITGPMEHVERDTERMAVRRALRNLPEIHREVLDLVFFHQLSLQEAADILDVSVGTVKSRLHRAKEALRGMLHHEEPSDA